MSRFLLHRIAADFVFAVDDFSATLDHIGKNAAVDIIAIPRARTGFGHHGILLFLTPGRYTFGDFLRVGAPLTLAIAFTTAWLARWLWLGGPLLPGIGG